MSERECERYLQPYREAIKRFGAGFQATLWASPQGQRTRFDVMIDLIGAGALGAACGAAASELRGLDDAVVLDVGCGTGDFAQRLIEREVRFARYIGVDAVSEMVDAASARHLPRCEFVVGDVLADAAILAKARPDFVSISGTLNTMDEDTARRLVQMCFEAATHGVAFNFLSNRPDEQWQDRDLGPARRFDTIRWLDWSLHLTSLVRFAQDYLDGHDATIVMRRE